MLSSISGRFFAGHNVGTQTPFATGLIQYIFPQSAASGLTTLVDVTGSGYDSSMINQMTVAASTPDYAFLSSPATFATTSPSPIIQASFRTISMWIRYATDPDSSQKILFRILGGGGTNDYGCTFYAKGNGTSITTIGFSQKAQFGYTAARETNIGITKNQWTMLSYNFGFTNGTNEMFVNGGPAGFFAWSLSPGLPAGSYTWTLPAGLDFGCQLGKFNQFSTMLSSSQINAKYQSERSYFGV